MEGIENRRSLTNVTYSSSNSCRFLKNQLRQVLLGSFVLQFNVRVRKISLGLNPTGNIAGTTDGVSMKQTIMKQTR